MSTLQLRFKDTKKFLYCKTCKKFPDKIIEKYLAPIEETRYWNGECYELSESNIADVEYESLCADCRSKLEETPVNGCDGNEIKKAND